MVPVASLSTSIVATPKRNSLAFQRGGESKAPDGYLVDPASSHMLVSKIKPCMSKYKQIYKVKLRMAH